MSHPDPLFDPENAYEDDMNYNDCNDSDPDGDGDYDPDYDIWELVDGDHDSAMTSCGWGTNEDYGDYEDFYSDDGYGYENE